MTRFLLHTNGTWRLLALLPLLLGLAACGSDGDGDGDPTGPGPDHQDDRVTFAAAADTWLDPFEAGDVHGNDTTILVGYNYDALLRFDLTGLPTDAVVTGVTLTLTQTAEDGSQADGRLTVDWVAQDDWDEAELNGDNAPDFTIANLGGQAVAALDQGTRPLTFSSGVMDDTTAWESLYSNGLLTLRLSANRDLAFASSEAGEADHRPALSVSYVGGTRVVLEPVDSGFTWSARPDSNLAAADSLMIERAHYHDIFLKFDLSGVPAGATLHYADLQMLAYWGHAHGGDGNVYTMLVPDDSWSRETLNYNNQPAAVGERLGRWWLWYDSFDGYIEKLGRNADVSLAPAVQGEVRGDRVLSLRLDSPGYRTIYYPADAVYPEQRPRLTLVYTD